MTNDERPLAIDGFGGGGGTHIGLLRAGYRVISVDNWKPAIQTQLANGLRVVNQDLQKKRIPKRYRGKVRLMWLSPPCPPFSQATDGIGRDDPRDCIPAALASVKRILPQIVMMENVKGLASPKHAGYMTEVVAELESFGYTVEYRVLNAADYGLPQARKRMYLVAVLEGTPKFPIPPIGQEITTMGDFLGWTPRNVRLRAINGGDTSWVFQRPAMTVVGSFKPEVMSAPGYRTAGGYSRQDMPGSVLLLPEEAAALQGFPPGFKFVGRANERWLIIGNAVMSEMAYLLARANDMEIVR